MGRKLQDRIEYSKKKTPNQHTKFRRRGITQKKTHNMGKKYF